MPRKSEDNAPHPLDIALGARVRQRRKELGLSQSDLGKAVGITFQQMQKYEHGTNRISFSRLVGIARALECSVADLIGDLDKRKSTGAFARQMTHLAEPGAGELLAAYSLMDSSKRRRAVLSLARQLARDEA
jgi:transcriptional regulator with XRE-family HTH domain